MCGFTPHPLFSFLLIRHRLSFQELKGSLSKIKSKNVTLKMKGLVLEWEVSVTQNKPKWQNTSRAVSPAGRCSPAAARSTWAPGQSQRWPCSDIALGSWVEGRAPEGRAGFTREETQVTLDWQGGRTCLLDKSCNKIRWIIYDDDDDCDVKSSEKILKTKY